VRCIEARIRCFRSEWVEVDGVKLLLYRFVAETSADLGRVLQEVTNLGSSWDSLGSEELGGYLREIIPSTLSNCSLYYVELSSGDTQLGYTYSTERLKCVPLSAYPDEVLSVELLSKPSSSGVEELDAVQRGILTSRKVPLSKGLYATCLVGEVREGGVVAVGMEVASGGLKVLLTDELKSTALRKVSVGQARKRVRRKRRRSRRKRSSKK